MVKLSISKGQRDSVAHKPGNTGPYNAEDITILFQNTIINESSTDSEINMSMFTFLSPTSHISEKIKILLEKEGGWDYIVSRQCRRWEKRKGGCAGWSPPLKKMLKYEFVRWSNFSDRHL